MLKLYTQIKESCIFAAEMSLESPMTNNKKHKNHDQK